MSQLNTVRRALEKAGDHGACLTDFPPDVRYTFRNRISELLAAGYAIESQRCRVHRHRSTVARYFLRAQGRLAI